MASKRMMSWLTQPFYAMPVQRVLFVTICVALASGFPQSEATANTKYAAIVIDGHTGKAVFSRSADRQRHPASLTKVMTLYMLFETLKKGKITLGTQMKVSRRASAQAPSRLGLKPGQSIRVEQAIEALVTKSANDVAVVIAEHISGTEYKFAQAMNRKARSLAMTRTRFMNASGLPNQRQLTTARDMAILARRIRKDFPQWYRYFSTRHFRWDGRKYTNHNKLLSRYKGTMGVKTGYTGASGFNLTAAVERGDKYMIGVVLGGKSSKSRDQHMVSILDRSWRRISAKAPLKTSSAAIPQPIPKPVGAPSTVRPAMISANTKAAKPEQTPSAPIAANNPAPEKGVGLPRPSPPPGRNSPLFADSSWIIQIGAYAEPAQAVARIRAALKAAPSELSQAVPITVPINMSDQTLYRSRFGGFDQIAARAACGRLSRADISCIAIPPNGWSSALLNTSG